MFTLSLLLAAGAGMLVAYALGQKDIAHARTLYTQSMLGSIVAGGIFTIIGFVAPEEVTRILCDEPELFEMTNDYSSVMLLGAPVFMLSWGLATMVGVDGSPRLVSVSVVVVNVVNLVLDLFFIKVMGWGITSSSAASVIGNFIGILVLLWHFRMPSAQLRLISPNKGLNLWGSIISQGAPLAIASVCLTLMLYATNSIVLSKLGTTGIFVFSVGMNLLTIYNLFLSGTVETLQSLGAVQVGEGNNEGLQLVLNKSFFFITVSMVATCIYTWLFPGTIAELFGAEDTAVIAECDYALRIFAISFIPFCYIYTLMIVYKLYSYDRLALFISFALSLTVIPVIWAVSEFALSWIWYSFLIAYIVEMATIAILHKVTHVKFEIKEEQSE
jgi:Na+-driven multidrug efflux pump